ncbi:stalk domain-containing protein [Marinicrinis lubricantis]|uniref:Stalk domain-containing protein n=1 Tax=Marinicrinis lubricantis TaxID=2086470 RepID=A0ABW1IRH2_9BACL
MKKRMFISGLIAGAVIASTTTVFAVDWVKAYLFTGKMEINGQLQILPEDYEILSYKNHTYVPLRYVSEALGADVDYRQGAAPDESVISIHTSNQDVPAETGNSLQLSEDFLELAAKGRLNGIEIPLGTSKETLLKTLGEPDEIASHHSVYYRYGNIKFYTNASDRVRVIDVDFHLTTLEVKQSLGKPLFEGVNEAGLSGYELIYEAGDYYLYFMYNDKEDDIGTLRFKDPRQ